MKYVVTLEFPASDNCNSGAVRFVEIEADNEEDANRKAILSVIHVIKTNRVVRLDGNLKPNKAICETGD